MGYEMQLSVLKPIRGPLYDREFMDEDFTSEGETVTAPRQKRGEYTLWKPAVFFNKRIPKITYDHTPEGEKLADMCMMNWIVTHLMERTKKVLHRRYFAPPFAIWRENTFDHRGLSGWIERGETEFGDKSQYVVPTIFHSDLKHTLPSLRTRRKHNEIMEISRVRFRRWRDELEGEVFNPIFAVPLQWERCKEVADWLGELEKGGDDISVKLLRRDRVALSYIRARRAYFHELGKAGNHRILFSFE